MKRLMRILDVDVDKWNMLLSKASKISWNIMKFGIFSIMFMTRYYLLKFFFISDDMNATCDIFGTTSQGQLDI